MRALLWIAPALFATVLLAEDPASPEELIKKLGHEDYAVREQATEDLIQLGSNALPALEKAIQDEDLEVRLRAGRAIRAIRGADRRRETNPAKDEASKPTARKDERPPAAGARLSRNFQIEMEPDGRVKVRMRVVEDGKEIVKEYEGSSLEELKAKHPELRDALGGTSFRWRMRGGFGNEEMSKLLEEFRRGWDDDRWKQFDDEWRTEMERIQRWRQQALEQLNRGRTSWNDWKQRDRALPDARILGLYAVRPGEVLNAQLGLRGRGIVVERVEKRSLAEQLGVLRHDVLVKLNGRDIKEPSDVRIAMATFRKGMPLTATVIRRALSKELKLGD